MRVEKKKKGGKGGCKFISLFLALFIGVIAQAETRTDQLMNRGIPGEAAAIIGAGIGDAGFVGPFTASGSDTLKSCISGSNSILQSRGGLVCAYGVNASGANAGAVSIYAGTGGRVYTYGDFLLDSSGTAISFGANTADASDNKYVAYCGGGAAGTSRGGCVYVYGNEETGDGSIYLDPGDSNAVNSYGDMVFPNSGDTLSIQEATGATACMGVATPNGNTPVAVTTSCAKSGARVIYSRKGSVTNMASISTTTDPSGSGFSFASTGASDTLASSVIWIIVKESA